MDDLTTIVPAEAPDSEDEGSDRLRRGGLFIKDKELLERLGLPEKMGRRVLRMLDGDRTQGFPQKQKLLGDRRYWPAVKAYFDQAYGPKIRSSHSQEGRYGR